MGQHAHTLHHGIPLAVAAQTALEASGEQWTGMRARVFDALAGFSRPASAYDIAEALSKAEGRRVAANKTGFSTSRPVIEVRGTCVDCG